MGTEEDWFNPPWADAEDETIPSSTRRTLANAQSGKQFQATTLSKLLKAHAAMVRLDTVIGEAAHPISQAILSRIALSEASGFLAHHKARISPRDLALRAAGITGSYTVAVESGRLERELIWSGGEVQAEDLPDDWDVAGAIAFARHLKRIPGGKFPLRMREERDAALSEIGVKISGNVDMDHWLETIPSQFDRPGLLLAAWIAAYGLPGRQRECKLDIGALVMAAAVLAETGAFRHAPLMIWSAPTSWLDRLGTQGGEAFEHGFLDAVAEAAMSGLREAKRLLDAASKIHELDSRRGSTITRAAGIAVAEPVITLSFLATKLSVTTRAASTIINRLVAAGFLVEITRRDAWRAYSIA